MTTSTKAKLWNQTVIQKNNNSYRVSKFDYRDAALKIFDLVVLGIIAINNIHINCFQKGKKLHVFNRLTDILVTIKELLSFLSQKSSTKFWINRTIWTFISQRIELMWHTIVRIDPNYKKASLSKIILKISYKNF